MDVMFKMMMIEEEVFVNFFVMKNWYVKNKLIMKMNQCILNIILKVNILYFVVVIWC